MLLNKIIASAFVLCALHAGDVEKQGVSLACCSLPMHASKKPITQDSDLCLQPALDEEYQLKIRQLKQHIVGQGSMFVLDAQKRVDEFFQSSRNSISRVLDAVRSCKNLAVDARRRMLYVGDVPTPKERIDIALARLLLANRNLTHTDRALRLFEDGYRRWRYEDILSKDRALSALGFRPKKRQGELSEPSALMQRLSQHWDIIKDQPFAKCIDYLNKNVDCDRDYGPVYQMIYMREAGVLDELQKMKDEGVLARKTEYEKRRVEIFALLLENKDTPVMMTDYIVYSHPCRFVEDLVAIVFEHKVYIEYDSTSKRCTYFHGRALPKPSASEDTKEVFLRYLLRKSSVECAILATYLQGYVEYNPHMMHVIKNAWDLFDLGIFRCSAKYEHNALDAEKRRCMWAYIQKQPEMDLVSGANVPQAGILTRRDCDVFRIARDLSVNNVPYVNYNPVTLLPHMSHAQVLLRFREAVQRRLQNGPCSLQDIVSLLPEFVNGFSVWDRVVKAIKLLMGKMAYTLEDRSFCWCEERERVFDDFPQEPIEKRLYFLGKTHKNIEVGELHFLLVQEGYVVGFYELTARVCGLMALGLFPKEPQSACGARVPSQVCARLLDVMIKEGVKHEAMLANSEKFVRAYGSEDCEMNFYFWSVYYALAGQCNDKLMSCAKDLSVEQNFSVSLEKGVKRCAEDPAPSAKKKCKKYAIKKSTF